MHALTADVQLHRCGVFSVFQPEGLVLNCNQNESRLCDPADMTDQEFAEMFWREYNEDDMQKTAQANDSTNCQAAVLVDNLVNSAPQRAFELLVTIIDSCKDNDGLAYIAAGPLENLFVYHGYEIINTVMEKADENEKLQLALSGVWLDEQDDAIFPHWLELMKRYNFVGDNPRPTLA